MTIGHPLPGRVTHATPALYPLPERRIRDFVISFLQIPPRDEHPYLDGWFQSLRSIRDSHPLKATSYSTHHAKTPVLPELSLLQSYAIVAIHRRHVGEDDMVAHLQAFHHLHRVHRHAAHFDPDSGGLLAVRGHLEQTDFSARLRAHRPAHKDDVRQAFDRSEEHTSELQSPCNL